MDPDRVAYLGTASKALAPGLRLGWMVLPGWLARAVAARVAGGVGVVDQLALADLLDSGGFDRQVRIGAAPLPPAARGAGRRARGAGARDGLIVGYAAPSSSAWSGALEALGDLLAAVR